VGHRLSNQWERLGQNENLFAPGQFRSDYIPSTLGKLVAQMLTPDDGLRDERVHLEVARFRAFRDPTLIDIDLGNFRFLGWQDGTLTDKVPHNHLIQFLAQIGFVGIAMIVAVIAG
jgi:hypothetical protein